MFSLHKTLGGVHPPQCKDTRDCPVTSIDPPKQVRIPLNMHIGQLYRQVQEVLGVNKAQRHLRGGAATRLKYSRG